MTERKVLIISSDDGVSSSVKAGLEPLGYSVAAKARLSSGIRALRDDRTLVLLELSVNGADPLGALKELKSYHPDSFVITIRENGNSPSFSDSVKEGAYCQLESPPDAGALRTTVRRAFDEMAIRGELLRFYEEDGAPRAIWESPRMARVMKAVERAAGGDSTVLIVGEPGTGKGLAARLIHLKSDRAAGPYGTLGMSADLDAEKFQSMLFRALSAVPAHRGKGGTLYVSNIESLDAGMEKRLIRLIKTGELVSPEGEKLNVRTRVVLSSNGPGKDRPLLQLLSKSTIKLPALRQRREDIIPLARHFLKEAAEWFETGPRAFSKNAERFLVAHDWPGNVKELKDTVRRTCAFTTARMIDKKDIMTPDGPVHCSIREFLEQKLSRYTKEMASLNSSNLYEDVLSEVEMSLIEIFLTETGSQLRTARALGMNRNTLRAKIKKYRIKTPRKKNGTK